MKRAFFAVFLFASMAACDKKEVVPTEDPSLVSSTDIASVYKVKNASIESKFLDMKSYTGVVYVSKNTTDPKTLDISAELYLDTKLADNTVKLKNVVLKEKTTAVARLYVGSQEVGTYTYNKNTNEKTLMIDVTNYVGRRMFMEAKDR